MHRVPALYGLHVLLRQELPGGPLRDPLRRPAVVHSERDAPHEVFKQRRLCPLGDFPPYDQMGRRHKVGAVAHPLLPRLHIEIPKEFEPNAVLGEQRWQVASEVRLGLGLESEDRNVAGDHLGGPAGGSDEFRNRQNQTLPFGATVPACAQGDKVGPASECVLGGLSELGGEELGAHLDGLSEWYHVVATHEDARALRTYPLLTLEPQQCLRKGARVGPCARDDEAAGLDRLQTFLNLSRRQQSLAVVRRVERLHCGTAAGRALDEVDCSTGLCAGDYAEGFLS